MIAASLHSDFDFWLRSDLPIIEKRGRCDLFLKHVVTGTPARVQLFTPQSRSIIDGATKWCPISNFRPTGQ